MSKPRLLDLFCGAGGCAVGYARSGFEVIGVDIEKQPYFPFEFVEDDALDVLDDLLSGYSEGWGTFDVIHASPPCQGYSHARHIGHRGRADHPLLIEPVREKLQALGIPWVIENVVGAPLKNPVLLCGSMFGLAVERHRLFETSFPMLAPTCQHVFFGPPRHPGTPRADGSRPLSRIVNPMASGTSHEVFARGMGIDWMPPRGFRPTNELREAIPPAYTEFIGSQLIEQLARVT